MCKPGDILDLSVKVKRARTPLAVFSGQITVNGEKAVVAEEITLAFKPLELKANGSGNGATPSSELNDKAYSSNGAP